MIIIAAAAKSLQSCPTLCDPIEDSPPGSYSPLISGRLRRHTRAGVCDGARGRASVTAHEGGRLRRRTSAAERSYPESEVRGRSQEDPLP